MNKVILTGNLGIQPSIGVVGNTLKTHLRIAVQRSLSKRDSDKKPEVDWFFVTVWGKQAELCHKYLKKGSKVLIEGSLRVNEWTEDDSTRRFATEITAHHVEFLDKVLKD